MTTVMSQDGPIPPRINIPGAIPLGAIPVQVRAPQFRNQVPSGPPLVRIRRPPQPKQQDQQHLNAIPTLQRSLDEAKPVTEEPEDEPSFIPHIVQQHQPQSQALHQGRDQFLETQAILPRFNPPERPSPIQRSQPAQPEPSREQLFSFVPDRQPSISDTHPAPPKQTVQKHPSFCRDKSTNCAIYSFFFLLVSSTCVPGTASTIRTRARTRPRNSATNKTCTARIYQT